MFNPNKGPITEDDREIGHVILQARETHGDHCCRGHAYVADLVAVVANLVAFGRTLEEALADLTQVYNDEMANLSPQEQGAIDMGKKLRDQALDKDDIMTILEHAFETKAERLGDGISIMTFPAPDLLPTGGKKGKVH